MPKVFYSMLIRVELIGPKAKPIGVTDGLQVKSPVLNCFDRKLQGWTSDVTSEQEKTREGEQFNRTINRHRWAS